ncbi:MAG TPA: hypothetical protein VKW06_07540 [Candidatus Angelobacter sp.]|nr:hypothetical protein [Candidatus Angelobacter sp.]
MTIFGYNTDVKHADVVYHVQSEARQHDLLLQTLVYVKGQCVGKHAFSYAAQALKADFSEGAIHELLKAQHKSTVDAIQEGRMESVLTLHGDTQDVGGGLVLNWINPRDVSQGSNLNMRLHVLDDGKPAEGADVILLPAAPGEGEPLVRARADASGHAELPVDVASLNEPAVIARASRTGKSATRKFRFRK